MTDLDVATPAASVIVGLLVGFFAGFCFSKRNTCAPTKTKEDVNTASDVDSDEEVRIEVASPLPILR